MAAGAILNSWSGLRGLHRNYYALVTYQALESLSEWVFYSALLIWVVYDRALPGFSAAVGTLAIMGVAAAAKLLVTSVVAKPADFTAWKTSLLVGASLRVVAFVPLMVLLKADVPESALLGCVLVTVALQACSGLLLDSVRQAAVHREIPPHARAEASSLSMFVLTGVSMLSAAVAGAAMSYVDIQDVVVGCALLSGLAALLIGGWYRPHRDQPKPAGPRGVHQNLVRGLRMMIASSDLRRVLVASAAYGLCLGGINYILPFFVFDTLGSREAGYVLVTSAFALGNLGGTFIVPVLCKKFGNVAVYGAGSATLAATYGAFAVTTSQTVAVVAMLISGLAFTLFSTAQAPVIQDVVPQGAMGTVSAVLAPTRAILQVCGTVVGFTAVVGAGEATAPRFVYLMAGVVLLGVSVYVLRGQRPSEKHS